MATSTRAGARDRLSFATIEEVLPLPDLLAVQKNAFDWFMKEGLADTLREVSPIEDYSGNLILEFVGHEFEDPKHSIEECREKDMVYGCPLFVTARFGNRETGEIKEQRVFMGEFPVMTPNGTFVINGTEKVVVSQLVRSPGIYFDVTPDKTSEKLIFGAKVIPARGAWLEFDTDKRNTAGVRIDRKRRQLVTVLLRALDFGDIDLSTDEAILDYFDGAELIRTSLERDHTSTREEALIDIYRKLRPGEPPSAESARGLIEQLFFSSKRYDLSRVGRYKANQKLGQEVPQGVHVLTPDDILSTVKYMVKLYEGEDGYQTDDIDHFGNRRIRAVGELIQNQVRIGLTRMERVVRERMTTQDVEAITPTTLINIRPLTAAIKEFFGTSQLCQLYDQTNSLTGLTHKRRLSALGPGGLSRERAGFEVRDVHPSHYGRMCPIETPEGPNIGLIGSLATYARINDFGFIETPYRKVEAGRVTGEIDFLDAHSEDRYVIGQANTEVADDGALVGDRILCRHKGEIESVPANDVQFLDVSPKQIVSVSSAMIPFLEHDDANRALMGSNMQRQAVPLLKPEAPYIGTGIEHRAAKDSGDMVLAEEEGTVVEVAGDRVVVEASKTKQRRTYRLLKFERSNQSTCFNQKPVVDVGQKVAAGDIIADGPCTDLGEMGLGKNLLVGFMTWEGHTFEDAIVLSERLVRDDVLTSIHIEKYEVEARDTKLGEEEITRDIPNVSEDVLRDLDERGIIRIGAEVGAGDYLVGKVTPKGETELTPEERLLRAIFGEKAREVRDTSLKMPHGEWGKVIDVRVYSREDSSELNPGVNRLVRVFVAQKRKISVGDKLAGRHGNKGVIAKILPVEDMPFLADGTPLDVMLSPLGVPTRMNVGQVLETLLGWAAHTGWIDGPEVNENDKSRKLRTISRPSQYIASPVFEGAHWSDEEAEAAGDDPKTGHAHPSIQGLLRTTHLSPFSGERLIGPDGKAQLYDGRTGEPYDHRIAVGFMYILKLLHLVDDKIHARSTGPYSMITQQPLGGKAQFGGQRFGEMEVWALEAYGAAHCLQELLTIKSDDVLGRVKVYEAIVKGENIPEPGLPESFKVLVKEMQSLCLNVEVLSREGVEIEMASYEEDAFRTAEELGIDISRPERASEAEEA